VDRSETSLGQIIYQILGQILKKFGRLVINIKQSSFQYLLSLKEMPDN
jgi:hypothetical protein